MSNPQIAVVGCGYWGKNLVRNFHQLNALKVICDRDTQQLATFQEQYPYAHNTNDYEAVLSDDSIDAVALATPAETHFSLAKQALESGKDVFVEKPLALTYRDGVELVDLAEHHDRILMVGHLLEYHPAVEQLKQLVQSGELGELCYIYSNRLSFGKIRREENILWSFAPHDIAILLRLVGEMPDAVSAMGEAYLQHDIADVTTTHLQFSNRVKAHVFVSWLHPYKEQKLVIIGKDKMVVFDDVLQSGKLKVYDKRIVLVDDQLLPKQVSETTLYLPTSEPLQLECRHFLNCIQTRSRPLTDGDSGLRVLKVLEMAQLSMVEGGRLVTLDQKASVS